MNQSDATKILEKILETCILDIHKKASLSVEEIEKTSKQGHINSFGIQNKDFIKTLFELLIEHEVKCHINEGVIHIIHNTERRIFDNLIRQIYSKFEEEMLQKEDYQDWLIDWTDGKYFSKGLAYTSFKCNGKTIREDVEFINNWCRWKLNQKEYDTLLNTSSKDKLENNIRKTLEALLPRNNERTTIENFIFENIQPLKMGVPYKTRNLVEHCAKREQIATGVAIWSQRINEETPFINQETLINFNWERMAMIKQIFQELDIHEFDGFHYIQKFGTCSTSNPIILEILQQKQATRVQDVSYHIIQMIDNNWKNSLHQKIEDKARDLSPLLYKNGWKNFYFEIKKIIKDENID